MVNMLWSMICLASIFLNIFGMPFWIYEIAFGPNAISYVAAIWTAFITISIITFWGICFCQIMILKYLYLTKWPTMAVLNDYFLSTFFGFQNMMISVLITYIRFGTGELDSNVHVQNLTGNKGIEKTHLQKTVSFW